MHVRAVLEAGALEPLALLRAPSLVSTQIGSGRRRSAHIRNSCGEADRTATKRVHRMNAERPIARAGPVMGRPRSAEAKFGPPRLQRFTRQTCEAAHGYVQNG